MRIMNMNLLDVDCGIIAHQVNCQGVIDSRLSAEICERWPEVKSAYQDACKRTGSDKGMQLGNYQLVEVDTECGLYVANIYGQEKFGNPMKSGEVYTDLDALELGLSRLCTYARYVELGHVYVPFGIGCGLGGETWQNVVERIRHLPIIVCKLR